MSTDVPTPFLGTPLAPLKFIVPLVHQLSFAISILAACLIAGDAHQVRSVCPAARLSQCALNPQTCCLIVVLGSFNVIMTIPIITIIIIVIIIITVLLL